MPGTNTRPVTADPADLAPGGPWKDALRQAPAAIIITDKNVNRIRIGGVQQRCSLVVLKHFHRAPER